MKRKLLSVMLAITLSVSCMTPLIALAEEGEQAGTTEDQEDQEDQEDSQLEYIYQKNEELETVYITCPEDGDYVLRFKKNRYSNEYKSLLLQMTIYDGTTTSDPVLQSRTIKPYRDTAETTLSSEYESALCIPLKGGKRYMATVQIKKNEEWSGINYNLEFVKKPTVTGISINNDDCQLKAGESNPYGLNAWQFTVSYSDGSEQHLYRTRGEASSETTDPYRLYDDYNNSYTFALKDSSQQELFDATVGGDYPVQIKVSDGQTYEGTLNIKGSSKTGSVDGFDFEINDDGTVTVKNYTGTAEKIEVPEQLAGKQVTKVDIFNTTNVLKEITVPEGVRYVNIFKAENVNIPSTVSFIYISWYSLNINVSEENPNFSSIDGVLFSKDKKTLLFLPQQRTGTYTVPDSVTTIKSNAISLYSEIEKLVIGKNVTDIANENAAIASLSLKSIEVAQENETFSSKDGVLFSKDGKKLLRFPCQKPGTTYNIPQGVTHICNMSFFDAGVKEINFSSTVTTIEKEAFWQVMGVSKIVLPANVTKIEADAFGGAGSVKEVTVLNPNCEIADNEGTFGDSLIRGFKGSTAEAYAKKYNQTFEVLDCDHSSIRTIVEKASIGKAGSITQKCDQCEKEIKKETIPALETVSLSKTSFTYNGKNQKPSVTVKDTNGSILKEGTDYTISYPENCKEAGEYTVTINFKGNYTGSTKKTYRIQNIQNPAKINIKSANIVVNDLTYSKKAQTVSPKVSISGKTLTQGKDYTVSGNTTVTDIGTYKITITGIGEYTGSVNVTYRLSCKHNYDEKWTVDKKANMKNAGKKSRHCTICNAKADEMVIQAIKTASLSKTSFTYNGKNRKPSVTVRDTKGNTLKKGTDYTVSYPKNCKKVGQYTVTIKFKGNYTGSTKKTYCIHPKGTSLSEVKAKSKSFTAKWKKQTTQTRGYRLQYATDKKFKKNVKNVTIKKNKTTSQTVKKLKAKKKYYVRIRTYQTIKVNGKEKKLYSDWSKAKNVTVRK